MINISWSQLENNATSKELSFESFCYQIAVKKYGNYGKFDSFYNTAGSEFYLTLSKDCNELQAKKGDVIGWQAKFWRNKTDEDNSPLGSSHRNELVAGLSKSITDKPKLKHWVICTPGKFSNNKPHYPWNNLISELANISNNVTIGHWHKDEFETFFHSNPDDFNSIFTHYFNTKFIGKDFINDYTQSQLDLLKRKFDTDLHIKDENELSLLNAIILEKSKAEIAKSVKELGDRRDKIKNDYNRQYHSGQLQEERKECINLSETFLNHYLNEVTLIENLLLTNLNPSEVANAICIEIDDFFGRIEQDRLALNSELGKIYVKDERGNYQSQNIDFFDDRWIQEIMEFVHTLKLYLTDDENSLYNKCRRIINNDVHVFGAAGFGKTNFACSIATELVDKNFPVLLLLGSSFKNRLAPKKRILELLDLDGQFEFKDFLGALNNLGFLKKIKVPIIIDGLNESSPTAKAVWEHEIIDIIKTINTFSNLQLITTCREKIEYVKQIFNNSYSTYKQVPNHLYLKGFTDRNINKAIQKYFRKKNIKPKSFDFDKNLFKDPLRLKIFSEVNEGKHNIDINIRSIVHSIGDYINLLSEQICQTDRRKKAKLKKGLKELGQLLWTKNTRDLLFFDDFYPIFDDDNIKWENSTTFQLIDEGLCFQRDLKEDDELVQFTYDLVGGYQIAKAVFFSSNDKYEIIKKLTCDDTKKKLFGFQGFDRHPLHEDILKAISFLLPEKLGIQVFEVFNEEFIVLESLSNVNLLAFDEIEKEKFKTFIITQDLSLDIKIKLVQQFYSDALQKQNFFTFDIIEDTFLSFNQFEVDSHWCEMIRKDAYTLHKFFKNLSERCQNYENERYGILLFLLLITATTDKKLRGAATKFLVYLGEQYPETLLKLAYKFQNVQDTFICESLICALTGVTLKIKDWLFTIKVILFYKKSFLRNNLTNHVAILDYIKTIFNFAQSKFNLSISDNLLSRNKLEKWVTDKEELEELSDFMWSYRMMDYDFIKYQITTLSNESYETISPYSKSEVVSFINQKIQEKGYSKGNYEVIENALKEVSKYKRQEISERIISYAQKCLDITYLEFAGYLMINNQLKPEKANTFRFSYINYDPTFPQLPQKIQLLNENLLPKYNDDIQNWILKDHSKLLNNIYVTKPLFVKKEMVLLYASIKQESEVQEIHINISVNAFLFKENMKSEVIRRFSNQYQNMVDFSQIFGGEIPWTNLFDNEEIYSYSVSDLFSTVCRYSWTSDRYSHPFFEFITPLIVQKLNLEFDTNTLEFINENGEPVTKYFYTDHSRFLFIDKEVLTSFLETENYHLVWSKYIDKYILKRDLKKQLNPTYKDFVEYDFLE